MKKLKLNLEDLKVVSFETTSDNQQGKGTAYGFGTHHTRGDCTELCEPTDCIPNTCYCPSEYYTCQTCYGVPPNCN